ncbi:hypothetical protein UPYG_G00285270 [Umbra pygmaea]|uniref:Uncharacterized protein n=1 Tax=Umbra pygmaea TaxID=75934 RepID=A0ABD0W859_UMBPY
MMVTAGTPSHMNSTVTRMMGIKHSLLQRPVTIHIFSYCAAQRRIVQHVQNNVHQHYLFKNSYIVTNSRNVIFTVYHLFYLQSDSIGNSKKINILNNFSIYLLHLS